MSRQPVGPRFIFHGNAMPLGARILADNQKDLELIQGPPSAALPVTGGWVTATAAGNRAHPVFKWGASLADCKGQGLGGLQFTTTAMASIADVQAKNDPHLFEASLLRIQIVSTHNGPDEQFAIVPTETVFGGLKLDNETITVPFDNDLARFPTFGLFEQEYRRNQSFFDKYQVCLKHPEGVEPKLGDPLPRNKGGYVVTSFVRSVSYKGKTYPGNVLSVDGFGSIYFGEVLMKEDSRRISMVRLMLGCAVQAVATCAEVDDNGNY
jgi:hypothetical protein